jgi:hypothetical protein
VTERTELNRALTHAINYHGLDAKLGAPDWHIAAIIEGEVQKWLDGTTDVQVIARMTPEERARIGMEGRP